MNQMSQTKGSFFSLFNLPPTRFKEEALTKLGEVITQVRIDGPSPVDAGYVYLGQFITHDATRMKRGDSDHFEPGEVPINELQQLRTPSLELDSVYGEGFDDPDVAVDKQTGKMRLGPTYDADGRLRAENDLPRGEGLLAQTKDNRNDENLIIAQLHVQFLKLHNFFVDKIVAKRKQRPDAKALYEQARKLCILHYQQVVLYDFLYEMIDERVWKYIVRDKKRNLWNTTYAEEARMPLEFSAAAFRFGHSMVRGDYTVNETIGNVDLKTLFIMTGKGGMNGHAGLPADYVIDWKLYFSQLPREDPKPVGFNLAEKINLSLSFIPPFRKGRMKIPLLNLLRGNELSLPDTQTLMAFIKKEHPKLTKALKLKLLTKNELNPKVEIVIDGKTKKKRILDHVGKKYGFDEKTPLWYYILAEAQSQTKERSSGHKLGTLGSLIVAEVIYSLILLSQPSIFDKPARKTDYIPTKTGNNAGETHFKFIDLLSAIDPELATP
ncbi:peroxidase family protein [Thalassomonas actiniarum]|uniref:Heme peroxidase n=1 Tax=Thalassomonas actiniarum TaxID=485447 RepID=A0AAF0C341_9GAMM|nr:peroxidase family protein [Thalassomonas actiniarum]WDD99202.1 hypothetical protein SG35_000485 [Thalassomonas actiniarum]